MNNPVWDTLEEWDEEAYTKHMLEAPTLGTRDILIGEEDPYVVECQAFVSIYGDIRARLVHKASGGVLPQNLGDLGTEKPDPRMNRYEFINERAQVCREFREEYADHVDKGTLDETLAPHIQRIKEGAPNYKGKVNGVIQ